MAFSLVPSSTRTYPAFGPGATVELHDRPDRDLPVQSPFADEFVWVGDGVHPNDAEAARALDVLAAVPTAAAVGWTVRGQPWSTHARRIRTAIVQPRPDWDIRCMRGVREVDSLSGRILVRRRNLAGVAVPAHIVGGAPNTVARSLRAAGFDLLLIATH